MKILSAFALLLAATAAQAVAPPLSGIPAVHAPMSAPRRIADMSDAGNAIFAKAQATPDPDFIGLLRQQRALHDQLVAAVRASTIDVDKVAGILKQQEELSASIRAKVNERNLAVLRDLPEDDRGPFLRALLMPSAQPR